MCWPWERWRYTVVTIASRLVAGGCGAAAATAVVCKKVRRVSILSPPVGRFLRRRVMDCEVRRVVALLSQEQALHSGRGQSSGEQRPLHRVGRLAGEEHLFHIIHLRAEEVR